MSEVAEVVRIESKGLTLAQEAKALVVVDQPSYDTAVEMRCTIKDFLDDVDKTFGPMKHKAWEAHKEICTQEKKIKSPAEAALVAVNAGLSRYTAEQDRIQREKEAEARRAAEEEARRQAEEDRLRLAEEAKNNGANEEHIDEILEAPIVVTEVAPAVVEPTFQKSSAVQMRDNWSATVTDLKALVKHIAKNPHLIGLIQVNQSALNSQARSLKEGLLNLPGVRVANNRVVASGRR